MRIKIEPGWKRVLEEEFQKAYFQNLSDFISKEYIENICFPPEEQIFSAFNHTPYKKVKVVIIGQDPYHGPGQAHGLCFSVNENVIIPPSLKNIFKEINTDIGKPLPKNGNLESWAAQGVLLLNAILTVRINEAGSHRKKGWETFTDAVIEKLSNERHGLVFMLWGNYAKKKGQNIDIKKHLILT